ncbi:MAG: nucleotidyltransferase domain-containing protein [Elusimicrobiota bacterium]|nr:nucleotidyltransferase domain-containing protein [Elusimicrobiota bacterium]
MSYVMPDFLGLSKSKARRALVALFFTNPDQEYFSRQLERLSGISVGNLQKELVKMETASLLGSRRLGNLKLYKLNTKHPLYPELKSVVAKTVGIEGMIRAELLKLKGIKIACIYGSFARGEEKAASDIDLLILGDVEEKPLIRAIKSLEDKLQREINYTLYQPAVWKKRKAAKDSFAMEVLRQPIIALLGEPDAIR